MKAWIDQLIISRDDAKAAYLDILRILEAGKRGQLIFKQWKHSRTLAQNRLMWMWNHEIADWLTENTDYDVDQEDVHEFLCKKFWPQTINPLTKQPRRKQTHKFNITQMKEHLERIEHWTGDKGIPLTQPLDYRYAMYGEV